MHSVVKERLSDKVSFEQRHERSERRICEGFKGSVLPREGRVTTKLKVRAQGVRGRVVRNEVREVVGD